MATTAVTPTAEVVNAPATPSAPIVLTPAAIAKVKEIMATQDPVPAGLRVGVVFLDECAALRRSVPNLAAGAAGCLQRYTA